MPFVDLERRKEPSGPLDHTRATLRGELSIVLLTRLHRGAVKAFLMCTFPSDNIGGLILDDEIASDSADRANRNAFRRPVGSFKREGLRAGKDQYTLDEPTEVPGLT